ncbi:MAG: transglutaminase N-terminal domain-containing protein [Alphaproteobacteria bacterium]
MTRYTIEHITRYIYAAPVDLSHHLLRLTPPTIDRQRASAHVVTVTPEPSRIDIFLDHFGNEARHVAIQKPHDSFAVQVNAAIEITPRPAGSIDHGPVWTDVRAEMIDDGFPDQPSVAEFVYSSPLGALDDEATAYAAVSFAEDRRIIPALRDLTARIYDEFDYVPGVTSITTPVAEVMAKREGVCQDFAHVMIAGLRGLGLPARYVSGYLRTRRKNDSEDNRGADASHAWVSVWCGKQLGWIDFDPTNNLLVDDQHIVLAHGRDFSDVTPLRGVILGGGEHGFEVRVTVTPLDDAPAGNGATSTGA